MQHIYKRYIACLVLLLCSPHIRAQTITLSAMHFPPHVVDSTIIPQLVSFDEKNTVYGLDVDLIRAAYASQEVSIKIEIMSWKRIMRNMKAGLTLGAVTCRQVSPRSAFSFFSENISSSVVALVTGKHLLDNKEITLEGLKSYKNVAVESWSQTNMLDDANVAYKSVSSVQQGLNLILRRGQEVLVVERDNADYIAKKLGIEKKLSFYDLPSIESHYYSVCFSKKYPDARKWRDLLNKGLETIKLNGVQERIFQRYGVSYDSINQSQAAKE